MTKLIISLLALSSVALARTPIYREKPPEPMPAKRELAQELRKKTNSRPSVRSRDGVQVSVRSWQMAEIKSSPIVINQSAKLEILKSLKAGEIITGIIDQSLIAFSDQKSPVTASAKTSSGDEIILIGEATLERNSKRILVNFNKARRLRSNDVFAIRAQALDAKGVLGIEGEYQTGANKLLLAEFLSGGAAAWADSAVERNQNIQGQKVEEESVDTHSKKALASAMTRSADRFAERARNAPEYSILSGPSVIQVMVLGEVARK